MQKLGYALYKRIRPIKKALGFCEYKGCCSFSNLEMAIKPPIGETVTRKLCTKHANEISKSFGYKDFSIIEK